MGRGYRQTRVGSHREKDLFCKTKKVLTTRQWQRSASEVGWAPKGFIVHLPVLFA